MKSKAKKLNSKESTTQPQKPWLIFLATFPPKKCGIATFTNDLRLGIKKMFSDSLDLKVVAVSNKEEKIKYIIPVLAEIDKQNKQEYLDCANLINHDSPLQSIVSIQHEYGIFGGEFGSFVLHFLQKIQRPTIVSFHTVLPNPVKKMRIVTQKICQKVNFIIVMTQKSKRILIFDYQVPAQKIRIIPHGIHSFPYENSVRSKKILGLEKRKILLTFGLLSKNKGIEYVIQALPSVVKKIPHFLYLIVGVTHPEVRKREGEQYRNTLKALIRSLKLSQNVKFVNSYQKLENLLLYLRGSDVYFSTSLDPKQSVSGTFSYALGSGRSVISTRFSHALEYLKPNMGIMVKPKDSVEYAQAILKLFKKNTLRTLMGQESYFRTRNMTWENVALAHKKIFLNLMDKTRLRPNLPPLSLDHLYRMTDSFALLQFAKFAKPEKESGYTVDDNARALSLCIKLAQKNKSQKLTKLIGKYLNFLNFCVDSKTGYYQNYVDYNRKHHYFKNQTENMENATARAVYALYQICSAKYLPKKFRIKARTILQKSLDQKITFSHLRAIAYYIKALALEKNSAEKRKNQLTIKHYAEIIIQNFVDNSSSDWHWFEDNLSYCNGVIPESLALAYQATGEKKYLKIALEASAFLIKKTFENGICHPIGQAGWLKKGKEKAYFDQQPEEVFSNIEMLKILCDITGQKKYRELALTAFDWFLGKNSLEQVVYDFSTGGCYDGVMEEATNLNEGAESTISYLCSRVLIKEM